MVNEKLSLEKDRETEDYARITAVTHVKFEHFSEHNEIEGYFADRDVPEYMGCDRLLKLDTLYGRIQLGYKPSKGVSFIFANMKTSLYDTVSQRYQKELKEYQQMRNLKGNNQNVSYQARRKENSAMILEKNENKPWTESSIAPYIYRTNSEALLKTMPYLDDSLEYSKKQTDVSRMKELQEGIRDQQNSGKTEKISVMRQEENEISHHMDYLNSMINRKSLQSRLFFRKINYAFDIQKHEMFDYYKDMREKREEAREAENLPVTEDDEDE